MLNKLTVRNLAVVEQAEAVFAPGLNVLTGETGAGKSVLMGALELVLGGRADASVVRDGAKEAEVEAVFGERTVRRTVTAQGRSRAWIDDESVSVAELRDFGRSLVDVHGPTANQRLVEESFQREALDGFGGVSTAVGAKGARGYAAAWEGWTGLRAELASLEADSGEGEMDMLRYQVNEIEEAGLSDDDETLAERHAAAAHAEEIVEDANAVTEALGGDQSAAAILIQLQSRLRSMARHMPAAAEWAAEAEELTSRIQELSRTVADAVSALDVGEEDLESLDRRLTLVNRLKRKYGATVAEVLGKLSEKKARLDALEHREERLAELRARADAAEREVREAGRALTSRRRAAATRLAKAVTGELRDLGFLQAKFDVALEPAEPAPHGCDRVVFMFAPNPGEPDRPLATVASSGEIARVMLALKSVLAAHDPAEVLVFDEIDANIGGEVGRAVGEKLRAVAGRHQVIAITHLPQSAVYGDRHLVVAKAVAGGRTRTTISAVEGESRVAEVARMLGGEKLTSVVRRHAEELLQLSR